MRTHGGNSPINQSIEPNTKSRDWRLAFRTQSGCGIHHYSPRSHGGTQTRSTVLKGFPSMAHQRAPAKPWPDQPPEWEMRMSGCRWTPIRLRVRALAVVRWRTVLESQPVFRGLFLALAVAAFVASCGNDAGDAVGKKNHEWLTRRWKHLKILWPQMEAPQDTLAPDAAWNIVRLGNRSHVCLSGLQVHPGRNHIPRLGMVHSNNSRRPRRTNDHVRTDEEGRIRRLRINGQDQGLRPKGIGTNSISQVAPTKPPSRRPQKNKQNQEAASYSGLLA